MKQLAIAILLAATTGACVDKELLTTGPTVSVRIESAGFGACRDSGGGSLDQDNNVYTLTFEVETTDGKTEAADYSVSTEYHHVTKLVGTLTVPGVDIPPGMFDAVEAYQGVTFTRHDPIVIPATAMGQVATVQVIATDSEGLQGNLINFPCVLD